MIYVTHDQVEAMTMADRIVVLTPAASPRSARRSALSQAGKHLRRRFIGNPKMNFLPVTCKAVSDGGRRGGLQGAVADPARSRRIVSRPASR